MAAVSTRRVVSVMLWCLVLALARRAGHLPLGTFDRELAKLDGTELA